MANETEDLVFSISADTRQMLNALKRLTAQTKTDTAALEKMFAEAGAASASSFDALPARIKDAGRAANSAGRDIERGMRQSAASVSQLNYQLQDIAVQMQMGTSPLTIALQQGTQIAQVFGNTGAAGGVKALGGAFLSLLSPVSLASVGLVAAAGYAVQYISTLRSEVPDTTEILKAHAAVIKSFDEAYGTAESGAKRYSEAAKALLLQDLKDQFGSLSDAMAATVGSVNDIVDALPASHFEGATKSIQDFKDALALLDKEIPDVEGFSAAMARIENQKGLPEPVRALAKELREAAASGRVLQEELERTRKRLDTVNLSVEELRKTFFALTAAATGTGAAGASAMDAIYQKVTGDLIPALMRAAGEFQTLFDNFGKLQDMVERSPLGTLSPLYSGGGQFLNPDQLQTFSAGEAAYREAGESAAASMLKGFEGFIAKAKWDVNAFRVGFGSDTVTRATGEIEKVTKDTVVTLADAERDLARRIIEFQGGIQQAIGVDTWRSLSEAQQAALTSIAYNYGRLPKSIVAAIEGGGGPQVVAQAIAKLSSNPDRRQKEAQAYLGGTGYTLPGAGAQKQDPYARSVESIQAETAALQMQTAALAQLNPQAAQYAAQQAAVREAVDLVTQAQAANKEGASELTNVYQLLYGDLSQLSPAAQALAEQIRATAIAHGEASAAAREHAGATKEVSNELRAVHGAAQSFASTFLNAILAGKDATEALGNALKRLGSQLLDMGIQQIFGAVFGGLLGGGGGDAWAGLRAASGGRVSGPGTSTSDSIPARLSDGEYVVRAKQARKHGALLDAINSDSLPGFATGGPVGRAPVLPSIKPRRGGDQFAVTYAPVIDNRGASAEAVARLERTIARDKAEFESKVVLAVRKANEDGVKLRR